MFANQGGGWGSSKKSPLLENARRGVKKVVRPTFQKVGKNGKNRSRAGKRGVKGSFYEGARRKHGGTRKKQF